LWSDYNDDPVLKTTQLSFDTAVAWMVFPNVQLDAGVNFGLNRATPAIQLYTGISQRFRIRAALAVVVPQPIK
jgi:hypothetical protein